MENTNMETDKEIRKYKDVIQVMGVKSLEIQKQIYSLYIKTNELQNQIEALESKNESHSSQSDSSCESSFNESSDESKMSHNVKSTFARMKEEIRLLELELKSKNEMIVMLELQMHTKLLYDEKLKNLHDRLMAHKKTDESEEEIEEEGPNDMNLSKMNVSTIEVQKARETSNVEDEMSDGVMTTRL